MSDTTSTMAWARSGAMWLTGRADGAALGPPADLVPRLRDVAATLRDRSAALGEAVTLDPLQLLAERAAIQGLRRNGTTSCGGATRLLPTADGWIALCLARPADVELVPAWLELELEASEDDPWPAVTDAVRRRHGRGLVERGAMLGLPLALLPAQPPVADLGRAPLAELPLRSEHVGDQPPAVDLAGLHVVDLAPLWAGPLCASLLGAAGATVWKVESTTRPDGARRGPRRFFDLVNAGKRSVAVDFASLEGRALLRRIVTNADVVIEGSRPRALEQLGIDARSLLDGHGPRVWISITAHGRGTGERDRVGFGDDAAVAGGLVAWDGDTPCFCADAVADPTTGLVAATACLDALTVGGRWLLDVSMSNVAAHLAGPTLPVPDDLVPDEPVARPAAGPGPELGADNAAAMAWLEGPS